MKSKWIFSYFTSISIFCNANLIENIVLYTHLIALVTNYFADFMLHQISMFLNWLLLPPSDIFEKKKKKKDNDSDHQINAEYRIG